MTVKYSLSIFRAPDALKCKKTFSLGNVLKTMTTGDVVPYSCISYKNYFSSEMNFSVLNAAKSCKCTNKIKCISIGCQTQSNMNDTQSVSAYNARRPSFSHRRRQAFRRKDNRLTHPAVYAARRNR